MEAVAELYAQNVGSLDLGMQQKKRVVMISSVSGKFEEHEDLCQIDYWVQNMLQPVRFSDALTRLCGTPSRDTHRKLDGLHRQYVSTQFLVEIGPHAALQGPIRETLDDLDLTTDVGYYSVLRRNTSAETSVMETLGYLKCHGFNVNLEKVNQLEKCSGHPPVLRRVLHNLPEYPFNHSERYWPQGRLGTEFRFRRNQKLDLLGKPVIDWNPLEPRWTNFLKLHELPWAADHQVCVYFAVASPQYRLQSY
jgi:acyl transferase domain-containing protein